MRWTRPAALALLLAALAQGARAGGSEPDTSLEGYLGRFRDSTEVFFREDTLSFDTTGVDSLGGLFTSSPVLGPREPAPGRGGALAGIGPRIRGGLAQGLYMGGLGRVGFSSSGPGALYLADGWSTRQRHWFRALGWSRTFRFRGRESTNHLGLHASIYESLHDAEAEAVEPDPGLLGQLRDRRRGDARYRRIGWRARVVQFTHRSAFEFQYRSEQARDLLGVRPESSEVINGTPKDRRSAKGRLKALSATIGAGTPGGESFAHFMIEAGSFEPEPLPSFGLAPWGAARASILDPGHRFTRVRASAGHTIRLGGAALLALQGEWASASEETPHQEYFAAGGGVLRGHPEGALFARQLYLARAEVLFSGNVLRPLHLQALNPFQISGSLFLETAATPQGFPEPTLTPSWPRRQDWASDVGISTYLLLGAGTAPLYVRADLALGVGPRASGHVRAEAVAGITFPSW